MGHVGVILSLLASPCFTHISSQPASDQHFPPTLATAFSKTHRSSAMLHPHRRFSTLAVGSCALPLPSHRKGFPNSAPPCTRVDFEHTR